MKRNKYGDPSSCRYVDRANYADIFAAPMALLTLMLLTYYLHALLFPTHLPEDAQQI